MSEWKIFYTDESSLRNSDPSILDDVTKIPNEKRVGVHSIIQPFDMSRSREVIEQYHYLYSKRDQAWIGVGIDGLLDHLVTDFDNLACVLNGRTMPTDTFWKLRDRIRKDPDVVGAITTAEGDSINESLFTRCFHYTPGLYWYSNYKYDLDGKRYDSYFTEVARHRAYPEEYSEEPVYGHQTFYN